MDHIFNICNQNNYTTTRIICKRKIDYDMPVWYTEKDNIKSIVCIDASGGASEAGGFTEIQ